MSKSDRRALIRDYKEQKPQVGVFAVRCAATGEAWVGISKNLGQQRNAIAFSLKMGGGGRLHRDLLAAHLRHGPDALAYEIVEAIDTEELGTYGIESQLKDRLAHWQAELPAKKVFG
ncbi:GIY-YIG nuclease family protein [Phenylobacterium sp. J367]|uniref:GIY-YIG nuclease family protein n=1 Tax=Phenylobacterium sp. J367 TaxID=2898435 RepID=UPI002150865F|nr:GIY-YIG nuclease family protein [Phenylobacterium sp. J367]MCR5880981.1 GIY-YIG nuclease family protein [Phenylobacterium sp. J367]